MKKPTVIYLRGGEYYSSPGRLYLHPKAFNSNDSERSLLTGSSLKRVAWATNEILLEHIKRQRKDQEDECQSITYT
jgi:hypothetical protein